MVRLRQWAWVWLMSAVGVGWWSGGGMACGGKEVKETIALDCYDVCTPGEKPDEACFRQKRDPDSALVETALAVASRYVDTHPPETAYWDWTDGVLMFALTELYRLTGETWLQDHYRTWMDAKIAEGYEIYLSDRCPPVLTALALYRETEAASYLEVVDTALHYLYEKALRTEQGGISHLGTNDVFGATLWLDSLFMFGMVLNRWGEVAADGRALDEMGFQLALFSDLLQKPSGLFLHAYNWPVAQDEDVFWGRGNAWITAAGFDYLRVRRLRRERDRTVEDLLARQVEALRGLQDAESGLWWTVLNRPGETYRETSAAALVVYGLARGYRYGFLGDDVLLVIGRALSGLKEKIVDDGEGRPRVTGISGPTTVGDFEHYASIGLEDDLSYGVGAVILALIECSGLPLPSQ